jgi:hypothetical protein
VTQATLSRGPLGWPNPNNSPQKQPSNSNAKKGIPVEYPPLKPIWCSNFEGNKTATSFVAINAGQGCCHMRS